MVENWGNNNRSISLDKSTSTSSPIRSSQPYHNLLHMNSNNGSINSNGNNLRLQQFEKFQRQRQRQEILLQRQREQLEGNNRQADSQTQRQLQQKLLQQRQLQQPQLSVQFPNRSTNSNNSYNPISLRNSQSSGQSLTGQSLSQAQSLLQAQSLSQSQLQGRSLSQQVQQSQSQSQSRPQSQHPQLSRTQAQSRRFTTMPASVSNPLASYKARKDQERLRVLSKYDIVGYIAAGTYGRVYKANSKNLKENRVCAIKKFKADKEGEITHYTGISQSACREMALCRELNHKNITKLVEIILEDKSIYMVFDFAEHDLLQIIHFHCHPERRAIPESTVKSVLWQLLNGVSYLHQNWVLHRDLKPANIMLTTDGVVKIGDLGLARLFKEPLQSLWAGDKVVVTIWYRAPELLFGARHYTSAIDLWAVGCVFAELLSLRPIFKGEEAKMDNKRNVPFQRNQVQKVVEILGTPTVDKWPALAKYPEYHSLQSMKNYSPNLESWYHSTGWTNPKGFDLLSSLLEYDPAKRITANDALLHPYFTEPPRVSQNVFEGQHFEYPSRRISNEDNDIKASSFPGTKRTAIDDTNTQVRKKQK